MPHILHDWLSVLSYLTQYLSSAWQLIYCHILSSDSPLYHIVISCCFVICCNHMYFIHFQIIGYFGLPSVPNYRLFWFFSRYIFLLEKDKWSTIWDGENLIFFSWSISCRIVKLIFPPHDQSVVLCELDFFLTINQV